VKIADVVAVLDRAANDSIIPSAPFDIQTVVHYDWRIGVVPILTKAAGFEQTIGFRFHPAILEEVGGVNCATRIEGPNRKIFHAGELDKIGCGCR
jgi:hypothetical protein